MNESTATHEIKPLTPPACGERWPGQGGFFICTLPAIAHLPARHLIAHDEDHDGLAWGKYGQDIEGARSRFDGAANTLALLAIGDACAAAQWAAKRSADGHEDFHLPSQLDLFMASLYAPQLFDKRSWYWSSTQASRYYAFAHDFEHGSSYWDDKSYEFRVRAFRTIQL